MKLQTTMKKSINLLIGVTMSVTLANAQTKPYSQQMAATVMAIWKDSFSMRPGQPARWSYDQGVILKGIEGIWNATGNGDYFRYIKNCLDFYVQEDGNIKGYRPDEFNIDHINNGKLILLLYQVTGQEKYKKAAELLRGQLKDHPRTSEGGFWHKKIYPWQMWLDGLYMGQPFYAEYAKVFHEDTAFNDIARQFILMERHARDSKTGLLYHGWDESREQKWANKVTGVSPNFWGRALGWFGMAMVDVLDHFPEKHPGKDSIIGILNRFANAVVKYQDPATGLWYDVVDKQTTPKNYFEASASSMLIYTLAKGMRNGYLPSTYTSNAKSGYNGIIKQFIKTENGQVNLHGTVSVSGLGGNPYRDGSFEYYMSEPVIVNDPKGIGAFIKCAVEMEMLQKQPFGKGKTVLLDNYFNNEWKNDGTGTMVRHHYTWNDKSNGGYSMLRNIFHIHGTKTASLESAPTAENLNTANFYIIVDPDTKKETERPNFIETPNVNAISIWVKAGGVLLLMGNDVNNAELEHLNNLASKFGIRFNSDNRNQVINDTYQQGEILIPSNHPVFKSSKKIFVKEYSSIQANKPATPLLKNGRFTVMASSKYGKGTVFAIGDPWIYNEYVDGRKLPAEYENYHAATDLVQWLIKQSPKK
jgi:unsaturated rhamnogalacturonyl hydrolase